MDNGTGTVKGTAVELPSVRHRVPADFRIFRRAASSADFSFNFTYVVNSDGSWTSTMVPGSYTETHVTGPRTGQTSTVDAIPPTTGMVSQDGKNVDRGARCYDC